MPRLEDGDARLAIRPQEINSMNKRFQQVVDAIVDQVEVCRICISADGKFYVPNEKDGKLSLLPSSIRKEIGQFAREFAARMNCPDKSHSVSRTVTRARGRRK
jgi:hypothetical protein